MEIYKIYIRPLLEYNSQIWSPHMIGDIDNIERIQRSFTKRLPWLRNVSYEERLQILSLETLELRRIMFDVTLMFKLVHKLVDIETEDMFTFCHNNPRGHSLKINHLGAILNCRKLLHKPDYSSLERSTTKLRRIFKHQQFQAKPTASHKYFIYVLQGACTHGCVNAA